MFSFRYTAGHTRKKATRVAWRRNRFYLTQYINAQHIRTKLSKIKKNDWKNDRAKLNKIDRMSEKQCQIKTKEIYDQLETKTSSKTYNNIARAKKNQERNEIHTKPSKNHCRIHFFCCFAVVSYFSFVSLLIFSTNIEFRWKIIFFLLSSLYVSFFFISYGMGSIMKTNSGLYNVFFSSYLLWSCCWCSLLLFLALACYLLYGFIHVCCI